MKLLFLHRFRNDDGEREFGGAERQLVDLARGLSGRGHDVVLVTFYPGAAMVSDAERGNVRIVSLDKAGRWDVVPFIYRLARTLRAERADINHGYLGMANALLVLLKPVHRKPVVWGVRASDIDLTRYGRVQRFDAWIERVLSRYPDLIIANSAAGKDHAIARGFPGTRFVVIHNGIDLDRFAFDPAARQRVRHDWGICADHVLFGRIGRPDPQKDFPTFLRAAAIVAGSADRARFVVVGCDRPEPGSELHDLAGHPALAGRLTWAGARTDMSNVYSALDVSVSSSAYGEGTPNVVAESMACGVPCVVTDVGDSAYTVGDPGAVVPRSNPEALASAMLESIDRPVDRAALRNHIATSFSREALITRTEAALLSVLERGART